MCVSGARAKLVECESATKGVAKKTSAAKRRPLSVGRAGGNGTKGRAHTRSRDRRSRETGGGGATPGLTGIRMTISCLAVSRERDRLPLHFFAGGWAQYSAHFARKTETPPPPHTLSRQSLPAPSWMRPDVADTRPHTPPYAPFRCSLVAASARQSPPKPVPTLQAAPVPPLALGAASSSWALRQFTPPDQFTLPDPPTFDCWRRPPRTGALAPARCKNIFTLFKPIYTSAPPINYKNY